jgi:adenine-specific DNA-methyltransferase
MPNLSQIKRQRMMEFLAMIKEEHKDDDDVLIALGEIEGELNARKYGLVWEEHEEAVDVMMQTHIPVFTEDLSKEINCDKSGDYNFLLEGDNLHSLRLLEKTHAGKIDVIYIDPPYNTGNKDFVYQDDKIGRDDGYRHSKWLSFISVRLEIARKLLSDNGAIFISIDDNEIANLRLLCDQIFGEDNFVNQITLLCNPKGRSQDKYFATCHEYLLVYSKTILPKGSFSIEKTSDKIDKDYNKEDENGKYRLLELRNTHREFDRSNRPNLYYPIFVSPNSPDGSTVSLVEDELHSLPVYPLWPDGHEGCWTWGQSLSEKDIHLLVGQKKGKNWKIYRKAYAVTGDGAVAKQKMFSIWREPEFFTEKGQVEFGKIFLGSSKNDFPQPKAVQYIKAIIRMMQNHDGTVLDFFAGSGTTGQAVMELNQEDGGNRKFILCTNNEGEICENITYPRIRTVISGIREDGSNYSDGICANLKYYHTDFVSKDEEYLSDALLGHIAEMIQLEHGVKLDGQNYIMVLDDEDADDLTAHWSDYPNVKALYVSKNVLFTTAQNALLKDVEVHIIPDYYFNFELREVGETW